MPSVSAKARPFGPEFAGAEWERDRWYPLKAHGCYVMLTTEGALLAAPMKQDGSRETDEGCTCEVEEPGSPRFLQDINGKFKTDFRMEEYGLEDRVANNKPPL